MDPSRGFEADPNPKPPPASTSYHSVRVRQFMNILEQLPRLCSPTICGTLSQPTTRRERLSREFKWSPVERAILNPADITTDHDTTDWHNAAEINSALRQQESERFFSQPAIAPSPLVSSSHSSKSSYRRTIAATFDDIICDDDEEEDDDDIRDRSKYDDDDQFIEENDDLDNLLFSPQPVKGSQTQQPMDLFSPNTFVRVMEDDNTLQSTPKTVASTVQGTRSISRRSGVLD